MNKSTQCIYSTCSEVAEFWNLLFELRPISVQGLRRGKFFLTTCCRYLLFSLRHLVQKGHDSFRRGGVQMWTCPSWEDLGAYSLKVSPQVSQTHLKWLEAEWSSLQQSWCVPWYSDLLFQWRAKDHPHLPSLFLLVNRSVHPLQPSKAFLSRRPWLIQGYQI